MSTSIGRPVSDCDIRRDAALRRLESRQRITGRRQGGLTLPNGEETRFSLSYALNYHKALPHDASGFVDRASYEAMVRVLSNEEYGAAEVLPVGQNRSATGNGINPPRYAASTSEDHANGKFLAYRKLTSPFTGHVFDTQGADAGEFAISPPPLAAASEPAALEELAAEMAEVYAMALLRDVSFSDMAAGNMPAKLAPLLDALKGMTWLNGSFTPTNDAEKRRFETRGVITSGADLFRGSTAGSKAGPAVSQFLAMGNDNGAFTVGAGNARIARKDGYVLYGTQLIDQRGIVAEAGVDFLSNWEAWLDCQNGVDFGQRGNGFAGLDAFDGARRFITTPRDLATYVHFDALYQAYHVACLLMLADGAFKTDRGLPETTSRTRGAFASFGGPHILSLVTEVATRALKAVWRQKWLYHRRARPEVVAGLLTLQANDPGKVPCSELGQCLATLLGLIPSDILSMVNDRNDALNVAPPIAPLTVGHPGGTPTMVAGKNYLLPMAFPEGSPTHPAYGAGHATVAGACVTVLKAFFEMFDGAGKPLAWPYPNEVFTTVLGSADLIPTAMAGLTIEGELDKLAANIAIGRNMAGVHYYTDYYESLRLGERIAVSILEEQVSMYGEPVSMSFTSFDGDRIRIGSNGRDSTVRVMNGSGAIPPESWYNRYAA
jgi:hypothetical protein